MKISTREMGKSIFYSTLLLIGQFSQTQSSQNLIRSSLSDLLSPQLLGLTDVLP